MNLKIFACEDLGTAEYDLVIVSCGYEARSRFICESLGLGGSRVKCYGFKDQRLLSYSDNIAFFSKRMVDVSHVNDDDYSKQMRRDILSIARPSTEGTIRILVDISSMPRSRIAHTLAILSKLQLSTPIEACFCYALAEYSPAPKSPTTISFAGPVMDYFAGWGPEPSRPIAAIVGLGYEPDKVLGALEFLESYFVGIWIPKGPDSRFLTDVATANKTLLDDVSSDSVFYYDPLNPFALFVHLESLCYGLVSDAHRPVFIPFGPKIFSLVCLLVSLHFRKEASVWRISSENAEEAVDRRANGVITTLKARFSLDNSP